MTECPSVSEVECICGYRFVCLCEWMPVWEGVCMNVSMGINVCECMTVYLERCIYVRV